MNLLPQVSVIMPTFEQSHFIRRARDSLHAQSMQDWELIIVDDGSEEGTPSLARPQNVLRQRHLYTFDHPGPALRGA